MTFFLLHLPRLAYKEVLLNYSVSDLVDFSVCSSRCHRIIRSIRFPFTAVSVTIQRDYNSLRFSIRDLEVERWDFQEEPWENEIEKRRINGIEILIQRHPYWHSNRKPDIQMKIAYEYVRDLFRLSITNYTLLNNNQQLFPQYFNITNCDELCIWTSHRIPVDELKYILEKVQISKVLRLDLRSNSVFESGFLKFKMNELTIIQAFWIKNETFLAMDCAQIELVGNRDLPIREFISRWLQSNNTRFEWLKITWNHEQIDWKTEFKAKDWDPAIRGRYFNLNKYKKLDCSGGVDLVREDGMLATVVVGENRICFVVWHTRFHPQVNNLYRI